MKKRISLILIVVVMCLSVSLSLAFLKDVFNTKSNAFSGDEQKVNVGVVEGNNVYENTGGLVLKKITSSGISKKVAIKNIDLVDYPTTDTYVRVRLVPSIKYNDNSEYARQVANVNVDGVGYEFSSNKWVSIVTNGMNYYYYNEAIIPGDTSELLISKVSYSGVIPKDCHFELDILVEGVAKGSKSDPYMYIKKSWNLSDELLETIY